MKIHVLCAAGLVLLAGCAHTKINQEELAQVKRVGLLSVTLDKLDAEPSNVQVLQQLVEQAANQYAVALGKSTHWELVAPTAYQANPALSDFNQVATSKIFHAVLEEMAQSGELPPADAANAMRYMKARLTGNKAELAQIAEDSIGPAAQQLAAILDQKRASYVAARGLAFVPYIVLRPDNGQSNTVAIRAGNNQRQSPEERLRDVELRAIGKLTQALGLDAMAVVYSRTAIQATVGANVYVNGRGLDTVRMGPTVLLVNRDGKVVVDLGFSSLDQLPYSRMSVPVYRIVNPGAPLAQRQHALDLNDPERKVPSALADLSQESADGLIADVQKALAAP